MSSLKSLKPNKRNPRIISSSQKKLLTESLKRFGDLGGIVYNKRTNRLVSGHQRVQCLSDAEIDGGVIRTKDGQEFSYREVDWDVKTETEAMIAANRLGGEWDRPKLLEIAKAEELDLGRVGFDDSELESPKDIDFSEPSDESEVSEEEEPDRKPIEKIEVDGKDYLNKVYHGDNLDLLKKLPDECVDLVYIDPPYFTQENFFTESGGGDGFKDKFKDIQDFVRFLNDRFVEIYRILKITGSFYLELDYRAVDYAKIALDEVFGYKNFKNKIAFRRCTTPAMTLGPRKYPVTLDFILFYTKSSDHFFNLPFKKHDDESGVHKKAKTDPDGRRYVKDHINSRDILPKGSPYRYSYNGISNKKGWSISKEVMKKYDKKGLLIFGKNTIFLKRYLEDLRGVPLNDYWSEFGLCVGNERTGYPTQKPLKMLKSIVETSSQPGDVVLDCFCGSGTTLAAAKELGRQYIGMDLNENAVRIARERLDVFS